MDSLVVHDPVESRVGSGKIRIGAPVWVVFFSKNFRILSRRIVDFRIWIGSRLDCPASVPRDTHPGIVDVTLQMDAKI